MIQNMKHSTAIYLFVKPSVGHRTALSLLVSAAFLFLTPMAWLHAADAPPTTEELLQRINSLEQELKDLKAKVEQQQASAPPPGTVAVQPGVILAPPGTNEVLQHLPPTPFISAGSDGFMFNSGDSHFVIALHGLFQVDSRTFFSDDKAQGNDSFLLRRARPILSGTVYRDFDFLFTPEFAGNVVQILDAQVNYRLKPELQLQFGKMKPPVGLEAQQPEEFTLFNERSMATDLVPYRDIGVELHGKLFGGAINYAAGLFNGSADNVTTTTNNNFDNNKSFDGRVFFQPFINTTYSAVKGLGVGVAGTYQLDAGTTNNANTAGLTQGFTTDGQQKFFTYASSVASTGDHTRITPQSYYYWGPLGLMGEFVADNDHVSNFATKTSANLENTAWEVSGGWMLTGEDAAYTGVTPNHSFSPLNGRWGAIQIVGRYARLRVDKDTFSDYANPATSANGASAWAVGLNWYLNRNLRINTSYSKTKFEGGTGAGATVTKQSEEVFFTRLQLVF
jgi:phosphate-selective porin OprO and OprP